MQFFNSLSRYDLSIIISSASAQFSHEICALQTKDCARPYSTSSVPAERNVSGERLESTITMQSRTILVADDDGYVREDLVDLLQPAGYEILQSSTADETWRMIEEQQPDLVLLDIKFPDLNDLSLLERIKKIFPDMEVIMLTSQTEDIPLVVSAIKLGAFDYVGKPFNDDELKNRISKALRLQELTRSQQEFLKDRDQHAGVDALIGDSAEIQHVRDVVRRLADADACVLIQGESGTGKELVARALHSCSRRRTRPFIAINCASIPAQLVESYLFGHRRGAFTGAVDTSKGKLELAEDGTIFFDEIGDMPLSQQAALLRVLEYRTFTPVGDSKERRCRARFVLASNKDLRAAIAEKSFRDDLYHRINVATIQTPSLRSRSEDIPELAKYIIVKLAGEMGRLPVTIHPDVLGLFNKYDWPGNVRELKNFIEGAMLLMHPKANEITPSDLPAELLICSALESHTAEPKPESLRERREKEDLIETLLKCGGNQTEAAKLLHYHRNTIRAKIRYYGIAHLSR